MDNHTRNLLKECNSGCKMAISSINQIREYVADDELETVIDAYQNKYEDLEGKSSELLQESGEQEKDPGAAASAFSWFSTEMKMMVNDDSSQIAKLMMDGCNMGIQSISKYRNEYSGAMKESLTLADEINQENEHFMKDLKKFR